MSVWDRATGRKKKEEKGETVVQLFVGLWKKLKENVMNSDKYKSVFFFFFVLRLTVKAV